MNMIIVDNNINAPRAYSPGLQQCIIIITINRFMYLYSGADLDARIAPSSTMQQGQCELLNVIFLVYLTRQFLHNVFVHRFEIVILIYTKRSR